MKVLNINDNTISFLPDSFGDCLPSLEILAATKNNLRRLPSSIGKLAKLKSLTLSHNKLNEVEKKNYDALSYFNLNVSR